MKVYIKPVIKYVELRVEEGLACTASTPIYDPHHPHRPTHPTHPTHPIHPIHPHKR